MKHTVNVLKLQTLDACKKCLDMQCRPRSGVFSVCNSDKHFVLFVCLFCCFTSQVNSYGHGRTVSSPSHTFFLGKLEHAVNQYFMHILSLVTDNNPS